MSQFGRTLSKPVLFLAGMSYFGCLCVALIGWHLAPEVVLALTFAGIGLIVMSLRPYLGVHVFIMTLFFENVLGSGEGITPMKVIGAVILAGWLVNIAMQRRIGLKFGGFVVVLFLFLVWSGVCLLYALDIQIALGRTFQYAQYALATLMVSSVVDTPDRIRRIYWGFLFWATLSAIVAVVMYYRGMTANASGFVGNRNLLAAYSNIAIICAYLLYLGARQDRIRLMPLVALPVLFLGIGLTFSRAGLISLALNLLVVWFRVARQRGFLLLAGSIGMICLLTYVLPSVFWQRAGSIVPAIRQQVNKDTFAARLRLWTVAGRMIEDRPVFGVGPGNFVHAFPLYARGNERMYQSLVTHNAFVGVTAENGLIGGALFVLLFGFALRSTRRSYLIGSATARPDLQIHAVIAEVSILVLFLVGLSGNVEGLKCLWMFFGLAVAMERMAERTVSEKRPQAAESGAVAMEGLIPWALARDRQ